MPGRSGRSTRAPGPWKPGPPFPRGNLLHLVHGAYSSRIVDSVADDLEEALDTTIAELAPWAAHDRHALTRHNLLETMAVKTLILRSIAETVAEKGAQAVPTRRFETALSALRAEREALAALGLSPLGEAQLRDAVAGAAGAEEGLAELLKRGRAARVAAGQLDEGEVS